MTTINARSFYSQYHGHPVTDLGVALNQFRTDTSAVEILFLAGDSSLDSKYWFKDTAAALNGWEQLLSPPTMKKDVAYSLNRAIVERTQRRGGIPVKVLNCAIEATSVGDRACCRMLEQDAFIRDNITSKDTLVVSVGGNDIALKPTPCTIASMLCLTKCLPRSSIERCACGSSLPFDDYCCGCCCGALSNLLSCPPGLGYFLHLFGTRIRSYVLRLVAKTRPRRVLVCMIYYPDELATGSWADAALSLLGYNADPATLQALIRTVYEMATKQIRIEGTEVVAVPLFAALDGTLTGDYCQRVEPSPQGGEKMAALILAACEGGQAAMDRALEAAEAKAKGGKVGGPGLRCLGLGLDGERQAFMER